MARALLDEPILPLNPTSDERDIAPPVSTPQAARTSRHGAILLPLRALLAAIEAAKG